MALGSVPGYLTYTGSTYAIPKKKVPPASVPPASLASPSGYVGVDYHSGGTNLQPPNPADPIQSVIAPGLPGGAPASDAGSTAGATNGYLGELAGDPLWQAAQSAWEAATGIARRGLTGNIEQLGIRSGYDLGAAMRKDPRLAAYAGDFTDADRIAAEQNPYSTRALGEQQLSSGQKALRYQLAGRGTLQGGGLITGNTGLLNTKQLGDYNAMNSLLDMISGNVGTYNTAISEADARRQAAQEAVATRLANLFGATYGGGGLTSPTGATPPATGPGPAAPPPPVVPGLPPEYDPTRRLLPGQVAWA